MARPAPIRTILAVSRVWLDLVDEIRTRQLTVLTPAAVLSALRAGDRLLWRGWTLRPLPAGILAFSALGQLSERLIDDESVQRLCRRIEEAERRARQQADVSALEAEDG
jgi:hypothetical protein